jgi:hypothetical protein
VKVDVKKRTVAKLSKANVRAIRRRLAKGESLVGLARKYGISAENIRLIKLRRTWRDA